MIANYGVTALRKARTALIHIRSVVGRWKADQGQRRRVDEFYRRALAAPAGQPEGTILADGLWDNPNHFFRLSLYLKAIDPERRMRRLALVAVEKSRPQRRTLQALGFTAFVELPSRPGSECLDAAAQLLSCVRTHEEFLALRLPGNLPAYVVYDAALKHAHHPQPGLDSPSWRIALARALATLQALEGSFTAYDIRHVVLSHPWGIPCGVAACMAIGHGIPTSHLTGYNEGIRIRRFRDSEDYSTPVEHLPYREYVALPGYVQARLTELGDKEFNRRSTGKSSDINSRSAFSGHHRQDREQARTALTGGRPGLVVLVCSHVWFDFPHTFAMARFTDFLDWMNFTLGVIREVTDVTWLLKPHPTEKWYGGFQLSEIMPRDAPHIVTLPHEFDQATALAMSDAVVTVHGTVGVEAGITGLPVLCADRSYYSDWPFVTLAAGRGDYAEKLRKIGLQPRPTAAARDAAAACFAAALAQPNPADRRMTLRCDSLQNAIYSDLLSGPLHDPGRLGSEEESIRQWLASDSGSYAAHALVSGLSDT